MHLKPWQAWLADFNNPKSLTDGLFGERRIYVTSQFLGRSITDIYDNIVDGLALKEPEVEPIFWEAKEGHVIAMDWCEGFMDAVALRPKEWLRLTESGTSGHLMTPILCHLIDENGNSVMAIRQEELDATLAQAAEDIPDAVVGVYRFWQSL